MALLNSGDPQFGFEARPLVEDVGGLPLALESLRGWLELRRDGGHRGLAEIAGARGRRVPGAASLTK